MCTLRYRRKGPPATTKSKNQDQNMNSTRHSLNTSSVPVASTEMHYNDGFKLGSAP